CRMDWSSSINNLSADSNRESFEKNPCFVIPAKAGIQKILKRLDYRLRGNDDLERIRRNSKVSPVIPA
ncbi:MAG: hypothetical protein KKH02_11010, partial [Proteobacteria bacterium]|nr:hypothetical protein [Pseudomonadota bacterium]